MSIRVLIADDEPLAREKLRSFISQEAGLDLAGECSDGREAVTLIRELKPDLVLLDIQMPELDGFGVVAEIGANAMPQVIFITAFDKFAVKAFEIHALDYILKPFDRERFKSAIERARDQLQHRKASQINERLEGLLEKLSDEPKVPDRIAIKSAGKLVFMKYEEIDWIEASDNYVSLHIGKEEHLHRETMNRLETKLPAEKFVRIGRSTIVNIDRIKELQPMFHGDFAVILRNGTRLNLSRNFREKFESRFGKV